MKRFTTLKMTLALVFAFAMFGTVAMAQAPVEGSGTGQTGAPGATGGPGMHHGWGARGGFMGMRLLKNVSPALTEAQQQQIKSIFQAHAATTKSYMQQMHALRSQYPVKNSDGSFNETAATQLHVAEAPLRAKMEADRQAMQTQITGVLNDEQKASLQALKAQMQQKMQERRAAWAAKRQAGQSSQ